MIEALVSSKEDEIYITIGLTRAQLQDEATYHMTEDRPLMCR